MPPAIDEVLRKLDWMRDEGIWPNGPRYLWTDAFGVVLLVSLGDKLGDDRYVQAAKWVGQTTSTTGTRSRTSWRARRCFRES